MQTPIDTDYKQSYIYPDSLSVCRLLRRGGKFPPDPHGCPWPVKFVIHVPYVVKITTQIDICTIWKHKIATILLWLQLISFVKGSIENLNT